MRGKRKENASLTLNVLKTVRTGLLRLNDEIWYSAQGVGLQYYMYISANVLY